MVLTMVSKKTPISREIYFKKVRKTIWDFLKNLEFLSFSLD